MGAGKTFIGKKLASELNLPFFDLDKELEKLSQLTITQMFEKLGEPFFRQMESGLLLNWNKNGVMATGGGIVENKQNREFLRKKENICIWLNPAWETIKERINGSVRPLVKNLSSDELKQLWQKRLSFYKECADIEIKSKKTNLILEELTTYLNKLT